MQTSEFGNAKGFWKTLTEGTWGDAYDGMGITLLLTPNPAIQVNHLPLLYLQFFFFNFG